MNEEEQILNEKLQEVHWVVPLFFVESLKKLKSLEESGKVER